MGMQQDVGGSEGRHGSSAAPAAPHGSVDERLAVAHDPTTDPATLFRLARDPSPLVRTAVAGRTDAPAEALRPLTRDRERLVREAVAKNPSTSTGNLLRLVADADRWVRWAVAGNPACDEPIRRAMSQAHDKELRGLLAELSVLEPELAATLIEDVSPEVRERLAIHTRDPDVITALMGDRTVRVRKGLARNPRTTAEQRHRLAMDSAVDVRAALVRVVELDEADLQFLLDDRSVEVRRSMATSALIPPHIRRALADDADETVAAEARGFRETSTGAAVRAPRVGHRRVVTGPARKREPARWRHCRAAAGRRTARSRLHSCGRSPRRHVRRTTHSARS